MPGNAPLPNQMRLTVSSFDVHLWSSPFEPARFNPQTHFLWSPADYKAWREAGKTLEIRRSQAAGKPEAARLHLYPLTAGLMRRNAFWKRFRLALDKAPKPAADPAGQLFWPVRAMPAAFPLSFAAAAPVAVRTAIWLWPFGWSSRAEFRLTEAFDLDRVRNLSLQLRDPGARPFSLGTETLRLTEIFRRLRNLLTESLGTAEDPPEDTTCLPRYTQFALQLPPGLEPRGYKADRGARWADADRLKMMETVRGRELTDAILRTEENFSYAPLAGNNFALTDFDHDSLLVLWNWKDRGEKRGDAMHCQINNQCLFTMVELMMHRLAAYWQDQAPFAERNKAATAIMRRLPVEYTQGLAKLFNAASGTFAPARQAAAGGGA